ncbi:MAG: hypothetical protein LBG61_07135 [Burkholderiales bacterium]|nr:hypothetical protein [Burkholderiales bacterium]
MSIYNFLFSIPSRAASPPKTKPRRIIIQTARLSKELDYGAVSKFMASSITQDSYILAKMWKKLQRYNGFAGIETVFR